MINETQITFKGEKLNIRFGMWVISEMTNFGYSLSNMENDISANPIKFFIVMTYLGACNASDKDLEAFKLNDFYDWLDEVGGLQSSELLKIQKCFTNSISYGVPKTSKKK